jgi:hypothetical protein
LVGFGGNLVVTGPIACGYKARPICS